MKPTLVAYFFYHFGLLAQPVLPQQSELPKAEEFIGNIQIEQSVLSTNTVPAGSQRVPVLQLKLTASCQADVQIDAIEVQHKGLGSVQDISDVYLQSNGNRLHASRQVQRNGTAVLHLRNFVVQACTSTTVQVAVDIAPDAAITAQHWFTIPNNTFIQTDAAVQLRTTSSEVAVTKIANSQIGTIDVNYLRLNTRVRYGTSQTVLRFQLQADNETDQLLQFITFTNNGSATNADLQNLFIATSAGKRVTAIVQQLTADKVTVQFSPEFLLKKNTSYSFSLKADVRASRSRTLQFKIEEPSDIQAIAARRRR